MTNEEEVALLLKSAIFYVNPGEWDMCLGMRLEMRHPVVRFVLPLVFKVSDYINQLTTINQDGNFGLCPVRRRVTWSVSSK